MNIEDYNFELPENLIAQTPLANRTASRLLVVNKSTNTVEHQKFSHIKDYFKAGDCLVLNNTQVLPARLFGIKKNTGAKIELLLLHEKKCDQWKALVKPARKIKQGDVVSFGDDLILATCIEERDEGARIFELTYEGIFHELLDVLGQMPLPPYIKETLTENDRYQTVFAKELGSAAAPTAGLHFTTDLLKEIESLGVQIVYLTLHVGLGTFRPVQTENITDHQMHEEYYHLSKATAEALTEAKKNEKRIITVGTTSTRVLETIVKENNGEFIETSGWTKLFIYPPYEFKAIDGMLTNFHLPKSTLLMLVSAFSNRKVILNAYEEAIKNEYRFFSFGDAMLII